MSQTRTAPVQDINGIEVHYVEDVETWLVIQVLFREDKRTIVLPVGGGPNLNPVGFIFLGGDDNGQACPRCALFFEVSETDAPKITSTSRADLTEDLQFG